MPAKRNICMGKLSMLAHLFSASNLRRPLLFDGLMVFFHRPNFRRDYRKR